MKIDDRTRLEDRHLACLGRQASSLSIFTFRHSRQAGTLPAETAWKAVLQTT
jgi:hypothetical protein